MNLMEIIKLREWRYFNFKWYKRFFLFTRSGTYLKKFDRKDWETTKIKFIRLYCFVTG